MTDNKGNVKSKRLLITGVTGYIGFKTLTTALDRGYEVRAVVRSEKSISELQHKNYLLSKSVKLGKLEFVIVSDFLKEDAVLNVLAGVTEIIHIASPLAIESNDYDSDIIKPAIKMVTTVLEAATRVPTIRRVVLTSSCVTLIPFEWNMTPDSERLYTEIDINSKVTGPFSSAMEAYWASKALARIETKQFMALNKPHFDFVNLLPSVVLGPDDRLSKDTHSIDSLLQGTRAAVLAPALSSSLNSPFPYVGAPVHVADVARAHVDAVDIDRIPGNTEYILSSDTPEGVVWDRHVRDIARKYFPTEIESGSLPLQGSLSSIKWRLDASKTKEDFGWEFTSFEETMKGLIGQYLQLREEK
ncbi:NAD(P)-binding protein [Aspergillus steynii IBT 23096]|uniref:NAD(P)-binding protein n=1 Tax=Aspergillus steynii IBT 23096 TaxID=1392250 RepID=A0A2I2GD63_9EURO|nr:NAD(P)-binding protein [Aspergillus steynii IBT 23096]PLB50815.1 NAD(P)-binding protein [Aspergillus steynii IBT 23096]